MTTLVIESITYTTDHDISSGTDLPGELDEHWEDVIEVTCERCTDPTSWPERYDGRAVCPPCAYYMRRGQP